MELSKVLKKFTVFDHSCVLKVKQKKFKFFHLHAEPKIYELTIIQTVLFTKQFTWNT